LEETPVELRHLRYFVAVAEAGSFVKAARALNLAQPALSRQVKDLERLLGVTLLERLPHGIRLTKEGKLFLVDARQTLKTAKRAATRVQDSAGVGRRALRIGYGELLMHWKELSAIFRAFRLKFPNIEIQSTHMLGSQIRSGLLEDRIDVGIAAVPKWPPRGLEGARIIDAWQTGALIPAGHPAAAGTKVRLADLESLTWYHLQSEATLGCLEYARVELRKRGFNARDRASRPGSFTFLPQIAAGGAWAPTGPQLGAQIPSLTDAIVYRPFVEPPLLVWVAALWKKGQRAAAVHDFVAMAKKVCRPFRDESATQPVVK
jgi:DNA-binding transcriptional LysR family regulator